MPKGRFSSTAGAYRSSLRVGISDLFLEANTSLPGFCKGTLQPPLGAWLRHPSALTWLSLRVVSLWPCLLPFSRVALCLPFPSLRPCCLSLFALLFKNGCLQAIAQASCWARTCALGLRQDFFGFFYLVWLAGLSANFPTSRRPYVIGKLGSWEVKQSEWIRVLPVPRLRI